MINRPELVIMFTIPGPPPVSPVQHPDEGSLFLRVNQRVAGEVLKVGNEQVILSIQGVQVVARLTNPEQLTALIDRRFAQFLVKDMSNQVVTLQLLELPTQQSAAEVATTNREALLLKGLLNQIGLPATPENQILAQAVIRQGLPVTAEVLQDLRRVLEGIQPWGETEANLAVLLKSHQVPVSPETLRLLANSPAEVTQAFAKLVQQLGQLQQDGSISSSMRAQISQVLNVFSQAIIIGDQPAEVMIARLKNAVSLLGKSLEGELANLINTDVTDLERGLLALTRLRTELAARGYNALASDIDSFNDHLRLVHLFNSGGNEGKKNEWIRLELPVQFPVQGKADYEEELHPARIRIARDQSAEGIENVNPHYTRIIVQVDLSHDKSIEVDLSVVSHQLGLTITGTDSDISQAASSELESLKENLKSLGFETRYAQVETGTAISGETTSAVTSNLTKSDVNLEV